MIDSHCHLYFDTIRKNIDDIILNSKKHKIKTLLSINTDPSEFNDHLNLISKFNNIYISYGLHPNSVNENTNFTFEEIINNSKNDKVIGIGETGLDFYYSNDFKDRQFEIFRTHIEASIETKLPIIIHQRHSEDEIIDIINSYKNYNFPVLFHCFTGSKKLLKFCLDNNFYISLSGIVTFKNANNLRDIIKNFPIDKLLIETDSPYLAPVPMRGKINEPSFIRFTAEFLSTFYNIPFNNFINITDNNFYKLFSKAKQCNDFT